MLHGKVGYTWMRHVHQGEAAVKHGFFRDYAAEKGRK
jgi:hypothetical protein